MSGRKSGYEALRRAAQASQLVNPMQANFDEVYANADGESLIQHFEKLTENERKKLAPAISKLSKLCTETMPTKLRIASLACLGFAAIKKSGASALPDAEQCFTIMQARRPEWMGEWAEFVCVQSPVSHWKALRRLELEAQIKIEHSPNYCTAAVLSLAELLKLKARNDDLSSSDLSNSGINQELIVEIFSDPVNISRLGGYTQEPAQSFRKTAFINISLLANTWKFHFDDLIRRGMLDARKFAEIILTEFATACHSLPPAPRQLTAQSETIVNWFIAIHDTILPNNSEKTVELKYYATLLSAPQALVCNWALERIQEQLPTASQAELEFTIMQIEYNIPVRGRNSAVAAIDLLQEISRQSTEKSEQVAVALGELLQHESEEVQKKSISLLLRLNLDKEKIGPILKDKLAALSILQRDRVSGLLSKAGIPIVLNTSRTVLSEIDPALLPRLLERIQMLDEKFIQLAGIPELRKSMDAMETVPALKFRFEDVPHLDPARRLTAITNFDELLFLCQQILHGSVSDIRVELAIDAISRLCTQTPDDLEERSAELKHLACKLYSERFSNFNLSWVSFGEPIPALVLLIKAWLAPDQELAEKISNERKNLLQWGASSIYAKLQEGIIISLAERLQRKEARPLLSAPTHTNYWIDPLLALERLKTHADIADELDLFEISLLFYRMAPDFKFESILYAEYLNGDMFKLARCVLAQADPQPFHKSRYEPLLAALKHKETSSRLRFPNYLPPAEKEFFQYYDPDEAIPEMELKQDSVSAMDALNCAIEDGRLVLFACSDFVGISAIAETSALHSQVFFKSLEQRLPSSRFVQSDQNYIARHLELLYTLSVVSGEVITKESSRKFLEDKSKGKGKIAQLARKILEFQPDFNSKRRAAALYALERRIERAERWQSWHNANPYKELADLSKLLQSVPDLRNCHDHTALAKTIRMVIGETMMLPEQCYRNAALVILWEKLAQTYTRLGEQAETLSCCETAISWLSTQEPGEARLLRLNKIVRSMCQLSSYDPKECEGIIVVLERIHSSTSQWQPKSHESNFEILQAIIQLSERIPDKDRYGRYSTQLLAEIASIEASKFNITFLHNAAYTVKEHAEQISRRAFQLAEILGDAQLLERSRSDLSGTLMRLGKHKEAERIRFPGYDPDKERPAAESVNQFEDALKYASVASTHLNYSDAALYYRRAMQLAKDNSSLTKLDTLAEGIVALDGLHCQFSDYNGAQSMLESFLQEAQSLLGDDNIVVLKCCEQLISLDQLINDGRGSWRYSEMLKRINT